MVLSSSRVERVFIEISCFQITDEIYVVWNTIPHFDLMTKDFLRENDNDFLS